MTYLSTFVNIFSDVTTAYSTLGNKCDHNQLALNLNSDIGSILDCGKKWLTSFNSTKTKFLSLNLLLVYMMALNLLGEVILSVNGLKITSDLK